MRARMLGAALLLLVVACNLLPSFLGVSAPVPPALGLSGAPVPPDGSLTATGFSIRYQWNDAAKKGNSSLLDVIVKNVTASDIGECGAGDLLNHSFRVYYVSSGLLCFQDDLQYNGTMWVALNYSLLGQSAMGSGQYRVNCHFKREIEGAPVSTTTSNSTPFTYYHQLVIDTPTFTYPANTSDTINVFVRSINSSIWGKLSSTSWTYVQVRNSTYYKEFGPTALSYNATLDRWSAYELNITSIGSFTPGRAYNLVVSSIYAIRVPYHSGTSSTSASFTFRGPYLLASTPEVHYSGRQVQMLNITVNSVWCSVHGYLDSANVTLANYSITSMANNASLVSGAFLWNSSSRIWYVWNVNISYYIEHNILHIGSEYHVRANFSTTVTGRHGILKGTSLFSTSFLLDRTPPNVTRTVVSPSPVTDEDQALVTCTVTDDARISVVIFSYFNGTHWVNLTLTGAGGKLANYAALLPRFHERTVVPYRLYANDSQNAWVNSSGFSYTVADTPPLIAYLSFLPELPTTSQAVTVTVTVTDGTAVGTVTLYYSFDGDTFTPVSMAFVGGNRYQAEIPAYPGSLNTLQFASVLFRIEASDTYGNKRTSSTYAYLVRGLLPALDPALLLFGVSVVALAIIVIIILVKIYERY